MMPTRYARGYVAALLLVGCGKSDPHDTGGFATSDLSLQILSESGETSTKLSIGIYARGYTYSRLQLLDGERLEVRVAGSAPIVMKQTGGSLVTYEAEVGVVEGSFEIALVRGNDSAISVLDLPPPFAITLPSGGISLSKPFTIQWSPASNDTVKLSVQSICVGAVERTLTRDPGTFTWSAADFTHNDNIPCTATINIRRQGGRMTMSPQLGGVQFFRAEQLRSLGVLASP